MSRAARMPVRAGALLLCMVLGALAPGALQAAIGSCTVSATGVIFGTYTPLQAAPLASAGTISIACTGVTGRTKITIDLNTGASGNYATRTLIAGAFTLNYNLYLDAANTEIWGNGTGVSVAGTATIRRRIPDVTLTVYGAVAARQDPAPGSYTDNITVSVNY
jgi:spore coat protein U-like protein